MRASRHGFDPLKRRVKRTLARLDIGVYRLSAMPPAAAERFDISFLPDVDAVVDVGVAYGTGWLYDRYPEAQLVLVDPVPSPELDRYLGDRHHEFVQCALGATPSTAEMTVDLDQTGASSLLRRTTLTDPGHRTATKTVAVRTLDDVVAQYVEPDARIGVKLDTEGYELEVLRGAVAALKRCAFVVCETSVLERFEGSYRFEDVVCFMREHGFGVSSVLAAEPDAEGRVRFVDLAFVPR